MSSVINIDFETRSPVNLPKTGVQPYAEHPDTDIWCMCYSIDGAEPETWTPGAPLPADLIAKLPTAELRAWNSAFEYAIWNEILAPRYGFPRTMLEQWVDTAAEAAVLQLPRSLADVALALGVEQQKDMGGKSLMMRMARPRSVGAWWVKEPDGSVAGPFPTKGLAQSHMRNAPGGCSLHSDDYTLTWWDEPEKLADLIAYCEQDVRTEQAVQERIGRRLTVAERQVEILTHRMNERGVAVDWDLVEAAQEALALAMEEADRILEKITGGAVVGVTKVHDIRRWVNEQGVECDNLRKDTVRDLLQGDLPDDVRAVLQIRQDAGKTSTAKLDAFVLARANDDRVHGLLQYHGAGTGRWAGRLVQPQNFPRPEYSQRQIEESIIPSMLMRDHKGLEQNGPIPTVVASTLRSMLIAGDGNIFMGGDYSQIEARVLAWMAGQDDLVDLFASGGKVYETMASTIFSKPVEEIGKDSFERQIGKMTILGAGFQMGATRFAEQVAAQAGITLSEEDAERAIAAYRNKNHAIKSFWYRLEEAALNAVKNPGSVYAAGPVDYMSKGQFLWCRLPSGRKLAYAVPRIGMKRLPVPWQHVEKEAVSFMTVNSFTRKWSRMFTYGGHLCENVVQATARDLMAGAMIRCDMQGLPPVLTVHDEVVVEVPRNEADLDAFLNIMQTVPSWAQGLPVAAEVWKGERYRK